jgi:hypothetical protein
MNHVTEKIIAEAITTTDPDITGISLVLDAKDEENSERMCNIDHEVASPYTIHTAILPKPLLIDANINSAIMAMLGGPAQDLSNFQLAPIPILSVPTCSTSSPHDILKVSKKKSPITPLLGGSNVSSMIQVGLL